MSPENTQTPLPPKDVLERVSPALERQLLLMARECVACGLCLKGCRFLQANGTPRDIALRFHPDDPAALSMAFACHLCGLCGSVCPKKLAPQRFFLELRREAVSRWQGDFPQHRRILDYERRGASRRFSVCALPQEARSVFFPGCTLPGIKPALTMQLVFWLRQQDPAMGVVLDCCAKPSHDLGRQQEFRARFAPLRDMLLHNGVQTVYTACPNCFKVFSEYGAPLEARLVYEFLHERWTPDQPPLQGEVAVHDPCPLRVKGDCHDAVRGLLRQTGLRFVPMEYERDKAICCGEGGSVSHMVPELAAAWADMRVEQAQGLPVATYCAGCMLFLRPRLRSVHVLDLLFFPQRTMNGKERTAAPPMTYVNRLLLKSRLARLPGLTRLPHKSAFE